MMKGLELTRHWMPFLVLPADLSLPSLLASLSALPSALPLGSLELEGAGPDPGRLYSSAIRAAEPFKRMRRLSLKGKCNESLDLIPNAA